MNVDKNSPSISNDDKPCCLPKIKRKSISKLKKTDSLANETVLQAIEKLKEQKRKNKI